MAVRWLAAGSLGQGGGICLLKASSEANKCALMAAPCSLAVAALCTGCCLPLQCMLLVCALSVLCACALDPVHRVLSLAYPSPPVAPFPLHRGLQQSSSAHTCSTGQVWRESRWIAVSSLPMLCPAGVSSAQDAAGARQLSWVNECWQSCCCQPDPTPHSAGFSGP